MSVPPLSSLSTGYQLNPASSSFTWWPYGLYPDFLHPYILSKNLQSYNIGLLSLFLLQCLRSTQGTQCTPVSVLHCRQKSDLQHLLTSVKNNDNKPYLPIVDNKLTVGYSFFPLTLKLSHWKLKIGFLKHWTSPWSIVFKTIFSGHKDASVGSNTH